jgi:hypothetical protein
MKKSSWDPNFGINHPNGLAIDLAFWLCSNGERERERALGEPCYFHWVPTFLRNVHKVKKLL